MCEHYKYMLQIKPEFDIKYQKTGIRAQMIYLCEVEDVKKGNFILDYDKNRFNLLVKECGKCHICRYKKASIKACQCQAEYKSVGKGAFVTFTFGLKQMTDYINNDKRYFKLSDYKKKKYINYLQWSLEKREFQLFMKRLRYFCYQEDLKAYSLLHNYVNNLYTKNGKLRKKVIMSKEYDYSDFVPRKIRFMHAGEYGENKGRPHHHAIIFGVNFGFDYSKLRWSWKQNRNVVVHFNHLLNKLWPFGDVTTDKVNYQTCNYVARYVTKKVVNKTKEYIKNDISGSVYRGRLPEYCTQSNRHGLGYQYYMDNWKKINSDLSLTFKNNKGEIKEVPLPRYFKELMRRYHKSDFLRMQKLSIEKQEEFSEIPPDLLLNRMLTDRKKVKEKMLKFKGDFESTNISIDKIKYLEFELKKQIFDDLKTYKNIYMAKYNDSEFVNSIEPIRLTCYKNFEKYRKHMKTKAIQTYVRNKFEFPLKTDLMYDLKKQLDTIKILENPFKRECIEDYGKKDVHIIEKWREYDKNRIQV